MFSNKPSHNRSPKDAKLSYFQAEFGIAIDKESSSAFLERTKMRVEQLLCSLEKLWDRASNPKLAAEESFGMSDANVSYEGTARFISDHQHLVDDCLRFSIIYRGAGHTELSDVLLRLAASFTRVVETVSQMYHDARVSGAARIPIDIREQEMNAFIKYQIRRDLASLRAILLQTENKVLNWPSTAPALKP